MMVVRMVVVLLLIVAVASVSSTPDSMNRSEDERVTTDGVPCSPVWKYRNKINYGCTTDWEGSLWCSTKVDDELNYIHGHWGWCHPDKVKAKPNLMPDRSEVERVTTDGVPCSPVWKYKNKINYGCTADWTGSLWCSTMVDDELNYIHGHWGWCHPDKVKAKPNLMPVMKYAESVPFLGAYLQQHETQLESELDSHLEVELKKKFEALASHFVGNLSYVRYLLWTRDNLNDNDFCLLDHRNPASLTTCNFNANRPTYFIVHGFQSGGMYPWVLQIKTDILSLYDANVISVDWGEISHIPFYVEAVENVYKVAELTTELIDWLYNQTGLAPEKIHMAGHSLGAQVCGMTGKYLQAKSIGTLDRITGMDPAGPLFHNTTGEFHIQPTDATFVDIIHTNGGHVDNGEIGMKRRLGDVDFYVNGGSHQAGCDSNVIGGDFMDLFMSCSHSRSHEYFAESIKSIRPDPTFTSWPCDSWEDFENHWCQDCGQGCLDMGFHVNRDLKGVYYLATHTTAPFAKGDKQ